MIKFKKTVLDNGIRVVSELHPQSRAVALGAWVTVGTRDEGPDEAGLCHFVEHLVFKGTKTRSAYQIAKSLEALGGELNAFTTRENTCYHALVLKDHWPTALEILADLTCNMQLVKKDFDLEKGVILQEIAMSEDNHEELVYDAFFERVYAGNPLGTPILGSIKSIGNTRIGGVNGFYKSNYNGSNVVISAAGQVDHEELVQNVKKLFKNKKKSRVRSKRKTPRWKWDRSVQEKDSEQVHMLLGFPTASFKDKQRFEAFILNALLGGGMTSRLYQAVRERKGLVYSVYSSLTTFTDTGLINIYAGADPDNIVEVGEIIAREMKKVRKQGISKSDLELFKTQVIGGLLLGADDIDNRMNSLGVNEMVFGKYKPVDEVVAEIEKVTEKSVNEFLKTRIKPEQFSGLLVGPGVRAHEAWWKELEF